MEQQEVTQELENKAFTNAFAQDSPAVETPAVETPAVETPAVETPAVETLAVETSAVETPAVTLTEAEYKRLYDEEVQKTKSWDGRIRAEAARAAAAEAQVKELESKLKASSIDTPKSLEEMVKADPVLKAFADEMGDDFMKPLTLLIKEAAKEIVAATIKPVVDKVPVLEQRLTENEQLEVQKHYSAIAEAHPDYLDILKKGELDTYVLKLPFSDAVEKQRILNEGTTKEVINLLSEFKEKTGYKPAKTETPEEKEIRLKKETNENARLEAEKQTAADKTKTKIQAATVVKTSGTPVPAGLVKPTTFLEGWDAATKAK